MYDLVLRGGTVVSSQGGLRADLGVSGGRIEVVGEVPAGTGKEEVDITGLHVLPGVIDTQVHFREPGMEHKETIESGSRAAAAGGVTTYFEMPNTNPATVTAELLQDKVNRGRMTSWVDFGFFVGATADNASDLGDLEMMPGTPGVKVFVGSSTGSLLVDSEEVLREVMKHGSRPMPLHCEDESRLRERKVLLSGMPHAREHPYIRDAEAAVIATRKVIRLSRETSRPVHILHISTMEELPLLAAAKAEGLPVTCEVTPNHLTFDSGDYETLGTKLQMNPPVRSKEHQKAIWQAVRDGLFDVFGSDHAPHTEQEKALAYPSSPSGMPGVQTLLPVMLDWVNKGALSLSEFVRMACERPAQLYGIERKGFITLGMDADFAIVDLAGEFEVTRTWLQSKCGWSPLEGRVLKGFPLHTVVRGQFAMRDGELVGYPGMGRAAQFNWKS